MGSLDLHGGEPFWLVSNGLGLVVPPLEDSVRCDVAVLGGGITGALVADALSDAGLSVVVLDRRHLGRGSTAASTALLQYDIDTPLFQLREKIGKEGADRAYHLGLEAIDTIAERATEPACAFARKPSLYFARGDKAVRELEQEFAARQDAGLAVEWLNDAALRADYGLVADAAIRSSVAAQVDPFCLAQLLLQGCQRRGVAIHDRTQIADIEETESSVTLTTSSGATVAADWLVHATGYESVQTLPKGVVSLHSTFAAISEPLQTQRGVWSDRALIWEYANPYMYARWVEDRLMFGGADVDFKNATARDKLLPRKITELCETMKTLCPERAIEPAFGWCGTFGSTKDGLGYIGAPRKRPRSLYALGFGGNGITYSAIARRILTNHILGRDDTDAELFRFGR